MNHCGDCLGNDQVIMESALDEARLAVAHGDVPVGAVVTYQGRVIARACNEREVQQDSTAHAELVALRRASAALGRWRLTGCTLYVTLEPCAMCAGALILSRIDRLVYGASDPKAGACGSVFDIVREPRLNHLIATTSGVFETECQLLLKEFFDKRREENRTIEQLTASE